MAVATPITFDAQAAPNNRELSLRGLPSATTLAQLYSFLRQTGPLQYVQRDNDDSNVFVCKYEDKNAAQAAFRHLHRTIFNGQPLQIAMVDPHAISKPSVAQPSSVEQGAPQVDTDQDFRRRRGSHSDDDEELPAKRAK
eukprot:m.12430 g.12430  ORF g.12430 m.12430 type:complete len:139 (+) comp9948_c0_seq2:77-493(+)